MKKYGLTLIVVVIALLPLGYWTYDYIYYQWFSPQLTVDNSVPEFRVIDLNGQKVNSSVLNGKVGVLVFFAHWCPACLDELPQVEQEIWKKYATDDRVQLMVIARAIDTDTIRNFMHQQGFTFPVYTDPKRRAYRKFARKMIPRTYVISRDGRIVWSSIGYNPEEFQTMLRTIVANL